mmetsp:Transcript_15092/g.29751  ORF Transcript_15092/g.29751 Transcript_15092/m.29751 type:complete len:188 (+) Transcript_15092:275-838(+)
MGANHSTADGEGSENTTSNRLLSSHRSNERTVQKERGMCAPLFGCDACCNNTTRVVVTTESGEVVRVSVPPWKEREDASVMDLPISHFPLHKAADNDDCQTAERLISWGGCDANGCDEHRRTPLHHAAHRGHADVAAVLLQHRADATLATATGQTPIQVAEEAGHAELAHSIATYHLRHQDASTLSF